VVNRRNGRRLILSTSAITSNSTTAPVNRTRFQVFHPSRFLKTPTSKTPHTMSAQSDNQQMEGVQDTKGKGKAPEQHTMEESMDDDSSDESGAEEQVAIPSNTQHLSAQTANSVAPGP
jgi:hypothetical protein